jgi:hypothetical protein
MILSLALPSQVYVQPTKYNILSSDTWSRDCDVFVVSFANEIVYACLSQLKESSATIEAEFRLGFIVSVVAIRLAIEALTRYPVGDVSYFFA